MPTGPKLLMLLSKHEVQEIAVLETLALRYLVLIIGTWALQEFTERVSPIESPLRLLQKKKLTVAVSRLRQSPVSPKVKLPTWDDCASRLLSLYRVVIWREACTS